MEVLCRGETDVASSRFLSLTVVPFAKPSSQTASEHKSQESSPVKQQISQHAPGCSKSNAIRNRQVCGVE